MKRPTDIENLVDELTDTFELYALCNEFGLAPFINGALVGFRGQQLLLGDVMRTLITEKSSPGVNTAVSLYLSELQKETLQQNSSKEEMDLLRAKAHITTLTSADKLIASLEEFSFKTLLFNPLGKELLTEAQKVYTYLAPEQDWKKTHHPRKIQLPFKTTSPSSTKTSQEPGQTADHDHQTASKH
jgi:hypothetical protein